MALQPPIIYGRVPQIVKGKILNPCPFPGIFNGPLKTALKGFPLIRKYPNPRQPFGHGPEHFQQFPVKGHKPPLIRFGVLRVQAYEPLF